MTTTFQAWELTDGSLQIEIPTSPVGPIHMLSWVTEGRVPNEGGSAVVLPISRVKVSWDGAGVNLHPGCYAQVPAGAYLFHGGGLIIYTPEYVGLPQAGGPVEPVGRLKYIDGCSDTLLICPARLGEPCLNLLHLPPGIAQTRHTHPSARIGIILRGAGVCKTDDGDAPLKPGMFWHIPAEWAHSFHTAEESLDVFAWHPDSDFGPSHDWHPMINRTIVDGVPANDERYAGIRTK